ncbi:hypothetical protein Leryth_000992, partial [Lithospermum erythrorhizon]
MMSCFRNKCISKTFCDLQSAMLTTLTYSKQTWHFPQPLCLLLCACEFSFSSKHR